MRTTLSICCATLLAVALAACDDMTVTATTSTTSTTYSEIVEADGLVTIHTDGLEIVVEPPIVHSSTLTMSGGETERSATINGASYGVRDGVLWIREASYGAVEDGDVVRVTADGVFVGDERRGDAP